METADWGGGGEETTGNNRLYSTVGNNIFILRIVTNSSKAVLMARTMDTAIMINFKKMEWNV